MNSAPDGVPTPDDDSGKAPLPATQVIREELSEIGVILDLPTRRPTRQTAAVAAIEPLSNSSPRWSQWVAASALVLSALIAVVAFWPTTSPPMPESLLGDWVTSNPQYQDKHLAFTQNEVLIAVGTETSPTRHPILSLQLKRHADSTVIALTYKDNDAPVEMHAAVMETGPQRLIFARPAGLIWERPVAQSPRP